MENIHGDNSKPLDYQDAFVWILNIMITQHISSSIALFYPFIIELFYLSDDFCMPIHCYYKDLIVAFFEYIEFIISNFLLDQTPKLYDSKRDNF